SFSRSAELKALISDIHGNLEALEAVLKDIQQQNVSEIYCLGDVVGYGPNPRECVDLVMSCRIVLLGNHDQGAMFDPDGFNPPAERAIFWTRAQLENPADDKPAKERRWEFLADQPRDNDPRDCYVLFDGETIRYRRVAYDFESTIKKIYAVPELENFLGDRLRDGR